MLVSYQALIQAQCICWLGLLQERISADNAFTDVADASSSMQSAYV
jgi:hypothetical protein